MNRFEARKQQTRDKHTKIYQDIIEAGALTPVPIICKELRISPRTYYRIIKKYDNQSSKDDNQKKYTNETSKYKIPDDKSEETIQLDSNELPSYIKCPVTDCMFKENCPINTGIKITQQDPIFSSFLVTHISFAGDYILSK